MRTAAIVDTASEALRYTIAASRRQLAGDSHGAVALFAQALDLAPGDPGILTAAADALRFTGQLTEAIALFGRALAADPRMVAAWYGRALALDGLGMIAAAARDYQRVTELAPDTAPGFAGLASMQSLLGEVAAARDNAARALRLSPGDGITNLTLARCDVTSGRYAAAAERLRAIVRAPSLTAQDGVVALGLLGDAFHGLGRVDDAFDAYARANARFAEIHDAPSTAVYDIEAVDAAVAKLAVGALSGPAPAVPDEAAGHIFLLGYPRSGTTLTEQVLATIPDVVTLEEAPTLAAADAAYLSEKGIAALARLGVGEAARLRADYWARVAAAGIEVAGKTFVDMDPFKAPALPLIARLFPAAKVVVMRRDPRDVVLSCFRRTFVHSPVTAEFTSLPRAARHYSAVMRLTRRCLETLPLTAHTLRYEDLVGDFDGATRRLCAFAGLPWSPKLRDFAATARAGSVKTASARQVRQPLFDGTGQWRKYARQLRPVLPMLEPWIS